MKWSVTVIILSLLSLFIIAAATAFGGVTVPFWETVNILLSQFSTFFGTNFSEMNETIIMGIRLPRVIVAGLVGIALAISGTVMQSVFRNPMADPGIIGVSTGGAFGGVLAIYFGLSSIHFLYVPLAGFIMALITLFVVYAIATSQGHTSMLTLLLTGVAVSSFLSSCISLLVSFANLSVMQQIVFWLMGDLNGRDWQHVQILIVPIILGLIIFLFYARDLDVLLLGEEQAQNMGIPVQKTRVLLLVVASLLTGMSVALTGAIGFVGLVVPHIMRLIVGPSHFKLLIASAFGGAIFLMLADLLSRMLIRPAEIQIGIVTAFFGAPFFIYLIMKNKRREA